MDVLKNVIYGWEHVREDVDIRAGHITRELGCAIWLRGGMAEQKIYAWLLY